MAGAVVGEITGTYDPNIVDGGPGTLLREANNSDPEALNKLGGEATFSVRAFTDFSEDVDVLNLNDLGVTFPVDSVRNIRTRAWARTTAGTKVAYSESLVQLIGNGSSAPALSVASVGVEIVDTRYVARTPLVGSTLTVIDDASDALVFISAAPAITGGKAVIRINQGGALTGVDLNWLVECEVGRFRILPVALDTASA